MQIDRAHPDLNQGPADLQSAALTTDLYTPMFSCFHKISSIAMRTYVLAYLCDTLMSHLMLHPHDEEMTHEQTLVSYPSVPTLHL